MDFGAGPDQLCTYGIAVLCADEPDRLVAARKGSPLIVGVGDGEYVIASDASAIVEHTTQVVYLSDGEMAVTTCDGFRTTTLDAVKQGFGVTVLADTIRAVNVQPGDDQRAIAEMKAAGADFIRALNRV